MAGDLFQKILDFFPEVGGELSGHQPVQVRGESSHVGGDGELVVIQDDDEVLFHGPGLVQSLEGLPRGHGAVPDDGDDFVVLAPQAAGLGHAQGRRDGGAGMAGPEGIVGAFFPAGKTADPPALAQGMEVFLTAGDQLVGIRLVPHVPDDPVPRGIEDIMERQSQLHNAQAGSQMAPHLGDRPDDLFPDFLGQLRQIRCPHLAEVGGVMDLFE